MIKTKVAFLKGRF